MTGETLWIEFKFITFFLHHSETSDIFCIRMMLALQYSDHYFPVACLARLLVMSRFFWGHVAAESVARFAAETLIIHIETSNRWILLFLVVVNHRGNHWAIHSNKPKKYFLAIYSNHPWKHLSVLTKKSILLKYQNTQHGKG